MKIERETVLYLAELARIRLSPAEVERMRADLDAILGYVEMLSELDTEGVEPTAHVLDIATPFRGDEVRDVLPAAEAVRNAPRHTGNAMVVPRVIE